MRIFMKGQGARENGPEVAKRYSVDTILPETQILSEMTIFHDTRKSFFFPDQVCLFDE